MRQVQWDALDAVWRDVKEGKLSEEEAIKRLERSTDHVWTLQEGPPLSGATVAPTPGILRDSAKNASEPKQDGVSPSRGAGPKEILKLASKADDRLIDATQTARQRPGDIIRN